MRRHALFWGVVMLAGLVGLAAAVDRARQVGQPYAGVWVMENLLVAIGGGERGGLQPFDLIQMVDGRALESGRELQAEARRHPPGTPLHYVVARRGQLVEADVPTVVVGRRALFRYLVEGLLPGLLLIGLGGLVYYLRPGGAQSWLFLTFSVVSFLVIVTYADAHTTYRFTTLFLTAWAFWPATFLHLALTFPQRRRIARRYPRVVWIPYALSAVATVLLRLRFTSWDRRHFPLVATAVAAYWGLTLVLLVLALWRTSVAGSTPLARQRARVLAAGFAVGYLPPVLGTVVEATFRVAVPHLGELWRLNVLFAGATAYAMVRYDLFDLRAAVRTGTVYSAVTGIVVLGYASAIALLDFVFSSFELTRTPIVAAVVLALGVVFLLNPVYARTQRVVDRVFFRQRVDVQRSIEQVSEVMTRLLDLKRIVALLTRTIDDQIHPVSQLLFLDDESRGGYVLTEEEPLDDPRVLPRDSPLPACLARAQAPVARERVEEDPALADLRDACLGEFDALKAELSVPITFQRRLIGFLVLGPKRSDAAYSTQDLRLLRLLVNQSALALEHAKAYASLEAVNAELQAALRRVQILESIRANLAKFVPRTVQNLIERAPEAPELDKREQDVSVLFVDIAGYTRLSERVDPARMNAIVERYFGSFLEEILKRGGDVNETAGDGLMVIFQDPDPRRHARAAVKTALGILRRTAQINGQRPPGTEPIVLHVAVNSGLATVGVTKIEGGTGTRWTYTASGPVTNLAARLAQLDAGDVALVGAETRRRLEQEFPFEALGDQTLRNVETPVPVFRLGPGAEPAARATAARVRT